MKPAAIAAQLVNIKNIATHKSIALTLHCPEEQAQAVIAAFGWPTMTAPVPVAIARLEEAAEAPPASPQPATAAQLRRWYDLTPAQQTGVIRNEPAFWEFTGARDANEAREYIRRHCGVDSCADIVPGSVAAAEWARLQVRYGHFLRQRSSAA